MSIKFSYIIFIALLIPYGTYAQKDRPGGPPKGNWIKGIDTNGDGKVDAAEFQTALARTFAEVDRNGDGVLQPVELPRDHDRRPGGPPPARGFGDQRPAGPPPSAGFDRPGRPQGPPPRGGDDRKLLPPFFFMEAADGGVSISRAEFERVARAKFADMDGNKDGFLTTEESRPLKHAEGPPPPPNARFIAAELRFGDKLVKDQPFSAETVIEDTRRLYDGSTVTKRTSGAVYRDSAGRTRREQPLEMVGGFSVVGTDNKPQMLVFINDFAARSQFFLDVNNKVARRQPLGANPPEPPTPHDAKTESLGTKVIEGVSCEGTRVSFEIPAGHLGNDKPIQVVTENWFSPDLQMLVLSRHVDPLAGEHLFKLVNIKRAEPAADLFTVPNSFRIVGNSPRE